MPEDTPVNWYSPHSGAEINLENPDPNEINMEDIALGLSNTNRYAGQTQPSLNVAQHSVNVADTLERRGADPDTQMYGLLHDIAEAYLGDVPRPAKRRLDGFEEMEDNLLDAAYTEFGVGQPHERQWEAVMDADNMNLVYEVENLFDDRKQAQEIQDVFEGQFPISTDVVTEYLADLPLDTEPEQARETYTTTFEDLMNRV